MKKLILSMLLLVGVSISSTSYAQEGNTIKQISEKVDEVVVHLQDGPIQEKERVDRVIRSFNTVDGIIKVEKLDDNNIRVHYTRSKLNGPGIFLGLAREISFREVKLLDIK